MLNQYHFLLIVQCHAAASESGKQRHHQCSTGARSMAGAAASDRLARRRDRLPTIHRRRSNIAKKKTSYWARGTDAATDKTFGSESESERASGSLDSQRRW
jgi:hypothetical protein